MRTFKTIYSCLLLLGFEAAMAQTQDLSYMKAGGLKLNPQGVGYFHTVSHQNRDSTFTNFVNFQFRGALWVGAITADGDTLVSCGDGNNISPQSEWNPLASLYSRNVKASGEVSAQTTYDDRYSIKGHLPLNLGVRQEIFDNTTGDHLILRFSIYALAAAPKLAEMYTGFFSDVDVPETNGKIDSENDAFDVTTDGTTGFIYNQSVKQASVPFLGVAALNVEWPIISAWKRLSGLPTDGQQFQYLAGKGIEPGKTPTGDYRFTISGGPYHFAQGDTLFFDLALVYGHDLNDLESNLLAARQYYKEKLPARTSANLALQRASNPLVRVATTEIPQKFALHQNYPNPVGQLKSHNSLPGTIIKYALAEPSEVSIDIYDVLGHQVQALISKTQAAGLYSQLWDGRNAGGELLSSGIYFYTLKAKTPNGIVFFERRKMLIVR